MGQLRAVASFQERDSGALAKGRSDQRNGHTSDQIGAHQTRTGGSANKKD